MFVCFRNLLPRINVNIRDRWDSTPLYYACLCGHVNIVQFLLENGFVLPLDSRRVIPSNDHVSISPLQGLSVMPTHSTVKDASLVHWRMIFATFSCVTIKSLAERWHRGKIMTNFCASTYWYCSLNSSLNFKLLFSRLKSFSVWHIFWHYLQCAQGAIQGTQMRTGSSVSLFRGYSHRQVEGSPGDCPQSSPGKLHLLAHVTWCLIVNIWLSL